MDTLASLRLFYLRPYHSTHRCLRRPTLLRLRRRSLSLNSSLKEDIRVLRHELSSAVDEEDYYRAASLRDEILNLEDGDPVIKVKKRLARAIEVEDYEIAAQLRDQLRRLDDEKCEKRENFTVNMDPFVCHSDVLTRGIRVRVRSFYVEHLSASRQGKYVFAYQVELTNEGEETVQLKHRNWKIVDGRGHVEHASGAGVIGQQPILGPGCYFQYMSICPLETPVGTMKGYYEMTVLTGHRPLSFDACIGEFGLDVDKDRH